MISKIVISEVVENKERKFGSTRYYYPCVIDNNGEEKAALFTDNEIQVAIERANSNPEDIPLDKDETVSGWFSRLFGA